LAGSAAIKIAWDAVFPASRAFNRRESTWAPERLLGRRSQLIKNGGAVAIGLEYRLPIGIAIGGGHEIDEILDLGFLPRLSTPLPVAGSDLDAILIDGRGVGIRAIVNIFMEISCCTAPIAERDRLKRGGYAAR
jgi:hypothetical protein